MAKDKLTDYSATNASNTDVGGVNIDEGMLPSDVNNAIREVMTHLKDFSDGTSGVDVLNLQDDDASASIKIQAPAAVTTTTTFTLPDGDGTSGQVLQTSGTGTLSWTSNGLANVVEDTSPQLGGNLDLNGNDITGTGNISTTGTATFTGDLTVDTNTLHVDSTNNRVGVGTTLPGVPLHISTSGTAEVARFETTTDSTPSIAIYSNGAIRGQLRASTAETALLSRGSTPLLLGTNNTEAARFDSSQNFLVGTTSSGSFSVSDGAMVLQSGRFLGTHSNDSVAALSRRGTDGSIVALYKDSTQVGSIGSVSSNLYIAATTSGVRFNSNGSIPCDNSGGTADNTYDLGQSSVRWRDLYLSGGVSNPSGALTFDDSSGEAMRISGGNLVVGATSAYATNAITAGVGGILYSRRTSGGPLTLRRDSTDGAIATFEKDGTTVGVIGSQYWGIGTGSPSRPLDVVADANDNPLRLRARGGGTSAYITFSSNDATTTNALIGNPAANTLAFYTNGFSERLRITSDGNLLVGKTANSIAGAGVVIRGGGELFSTRAGDVAGFNRLTTDGQIVQFYKDGSVVGGIGVKVRTSQGRISVGNSNTRLLFDNGVDAIIPANNDGNDRDNALDLGQSGARFDDIYATNGTIQTSDQNEKQQIASLTDAEITAAKAISQLFKTFKWNDKVAAKGDAARTHTGVIAQDVEAAMTAAGLDAGDYAFFISTDWYVDADGNEVEADAEGAIAKNRKGIRYPELLSFVGAATEQRLANIETRLAALEAN